MDFLSTQYPNIIGLTGVALCLCSYLLVQVGLWSANTIRYTATNIVASSLILFSLFFFWNLASFVIEICWMSISLAGLFYAYRKTSNKAPRTHASAQNLNRNSTR